MKIRRFIVAMLAVCITIAGLSGCSTKKAGGKSGDDGKGRYVEKEIELPLKENEEAVGLVKGEEKGAVLFALNQADSTYLAYHYDGNAFTEGDASWLTHAGQSKDRLIKVIRGEDGNLYALFSDSEGRSYVAKDAGDGSSQTIDIPALGMDSGEMYPYITNICVDKEGNIFLADLLTGETAMYEQGTGEKIRSFVSGQSLNVAAMPMDVKDNKILLSGSEDGELFCYDTESGNELDKTVYADMDLGGIVKLGDSDDCIYADSKGLHHLTLGGSISEDLIGQNTSGFGAAQASIVDMVEAVKGEYTLLFSNQSISGSTTFKMYRYVYDKTAKAKPSQILTVYGLNESSAVRQAIAKFQEDHPDVGIEYKTGNVGEGTGTKADSIRALNTELLGGSGADILMLDGLPADSYIEKGVLADLGSLLKEIEKKSEIMDNIVGPYKKEGKIYQIPTRYGIPILAGSGDKTEIFKSSDALTAYIAEHGWENVFEKTNREAVMRLLLNIYYRDIINDKQQIDTKLLSKLIEAAGKVKESDDNTGLSFYGEDGGQEESDWDVGGAGSMAEDGSISAHEIKGVMGMMMPFHYLRKMGAVPADVNEIYTPHDIVGINKASKNIELAEEFVKVLLSEEIQSVDIEGGFPVNMPAMKAWIDDIDEEPGENAAEIGISSSASATDDGESGEPVEDIIRLPSRSEVQSLAEMGKKLAVPVQKDDIIGEMILDGAKTYFDGSRSAEEAAADIAEKADTYLSE